MTKQKPWDQFEAIILLEAVIQIHEGHVDRKKTIAKVSASLRTKARNEGVIIDDVFRNEAGITFQMYSMESAYLGYTVMKKPPTKLFSKVVRLRASDRERYNTLLNEAKGMIVDSYNRESYQDWLMQEGMQKAAARNYGRRLNKLDEYLQQNGLSDQTLYNYVDIDELLRIYEIISKDEELISNHRGYLVAFRKYVLFRSGGSVQLGRGKGSSARNDNPERSAFQAWLIQEGMKKAAARNYGGWLNRIDSYVQEHDYCSKSIYEYDDPVELAELYKRLLLDDEISTKHRDYLTAFRKYIFYKSNGDIEFGRKKRQLSKGNSGSKKVKTDKASSPIITEQEKCRFAQLLNDFFCDGLVLNAIRLDKFRMLYENKFGIELTDDDELLINQLKAAGNYIDGRIYPEQNTDQNELLDDIIREIMNAFDKGACCIYIDCVMSRWQNDLANQLNVYNNVALKDLIMSKNLPDVFATSDVFKKTKEKVFPENDILEYMKKSHIPVGYDELQNEFWYFPLEIIKYTLVTTPSLVLVDSETYMYAPNFPASARELQHLVTIMKKRISAKGYLVAKDIAELISEKCPAIAINTEGYKDWAYRNVLRYLFRDYFEFGGSVVSEKGKKLEMWQVFSGFCREHERLTVMELKQFSSEIGVQIYWGAVLEEMVRINEKELIRKDLIHFDVESIDHVLDELCYKDYLPIKEVKLFLHFPPIGYSWNSFILESYLQYSKRFKLYHTGYSETGVFGVIVRRSAPYFDYRQVVVDMLANSDEWNDADSALTLIVEKGFQARKRWSDFDKVVQEAMLQREKKHMKRR